MSRQLGIVKYPMKVPHVEMRNFDNDGWPDLYTAIVIHRDGKLYPAIDLMSYAKNMIGSLRFPDAVPP